MVKVLQVRVSEDDHKLAGELAEDYGVSVSELVRLLLTYADEHRPEVTFTYRPKNKAK